MEITKKRRQRHWRQTDLEHKTLKSGHNIPWKQQTCLRFWKFQIIVNVTEEENIQPSWKGNRQQQAVSNKTTLLWVFKEWRLKLLWRFLHLPLPMVPASLLKTIYLKEREKEFFTCVVKIQNSLFMSFGRLKISHFKKQTHLISAHNSRQSGHPLWHNHSHLTTTSNQVHTQKRGIFQVLLSVIYCHLENGRTCNGPNNYTTKTTNNIILYLHTN